MDFRLEFTDEADETLDSLEGDKSQKARLKAVRKQLGYLEKNPRHPSLNSKPYRTLSGPQGEPVWESYAQNNTPGAYRILWYYSKNESRVIVIAAIEPHR